MRRKPGAREFAVDAVPVSDGDAFTAAAGRANLHGPDAAAECAAENADVSVAAGAADGVSDVRGDHYGAVVAVIWREPVSECAVDVCAGGQYAGAGGLCGG